MAPGLMRYRSFEWLPTPRHPRVVGAADASHEPPSGGGERGALDARLDRATALMAGPAVTADVSSLLAPPLNGTADPHG